MAVRVIIAEERPMQQPRVPGPGFRTALRSIGVLVVGLAAASCGGGGGVIPPGDAITGVPPVNDACVGTGCSQGLPDVGQVGAEFTPAPPEDRPITDQNGDAQWQTDVPERDRQLRDSPPPGDNPERDVPVRDVPTRDAPPSDLTADAPAVPGEWACEPQYYGAGDGCDCGCRGLDPDCGGGGCAEPGCTDAACDFCTDVNGQQIACPGGGGGSDGGSGGSWTCNPLYEGGGDGCDCGCGSPDPDCGGGGCTDPGCSDPACDYCYDASGDIISCAGGGGGGWTCDPSYYDAFDGCDCGCGIPDPDCFGGGCSEPGCTDFSCDYCYDASGLNISC
jgi:hypothetical protein